MFSAIIIYIFFYLYLATLHNAMKVISVGYIPRCRSLRYLHNRGPKARGCVNRVETEPRYITDLYHGPCGHTTHPHPSNDSAGYKSQLEWHPATVRIVVKKLASIKHRPMAESLVINLQPRYTV